MNLLFLCTSLEPGRDGVGDYTRQLAETCVEAGHGCKIIALHDPFVPESREEMQGGRDHEIFCVRLTTQQTWAERTYLTRNYVGTFQPDWLSWQVVPYGFHPKGILPKEVIALGEIGASRSVHVMLHELWIGLSRGEPLRHRFWGRFQRRALRRFLKAVHPQVLHTSNIAFQSALDHEGWSSEVLPLFGNIPIVPVSAAPETRRDEWVGGIFGTIHPQFKAKQCFDKLIEGARASGRRFSLVGMGRHGEYGDQFMAGLKRDYAGQMDVTVLGALSPEDVSRWLQTLDFGIATHPWALVGKSGAAAAMLDHGVPVIVPREDWELRRSSMSIPPVDPLVIRLSQMPPEHMAGKLARKRQPAPRLPIVSATFLDRLYAASGSPAST